MSEKLKLGLTRNRLFEFDNCVCFTGLVDFEFDSAECEKALKMLFVKEPLLTAVVDLQGDGDAFLEFGRVEPRFEFTDGSVNELLEKKKAEGFNFVEKLFSFSVVGKNTLVICGHTLVADSRSLITLAIEFIEFYKKEKIDVGSLPVRVFSEAVELPREVFSIVVNRLASELETGWQKKIAVFSEEDYKRARDKYISSKSSEKAISFNITSDITESLEEFSEKERVDVSSVVAYAFYVALSKRLSGMKKYKKLNIQANQRVFFEDFEGMKVGAFNGMFNVGERKKKKQPQTVTEEIKAFHNEIYKKSTSAFSVFYNDMILFGLPGSFCDSQYMYSVGEFKHKYSKKLARTYGCGNEVMSEFCSLNLTQDYWEGVSAFENVWVSEPFKMRSSSFVTLLNTPFGMSVDFRYKTDKITESVAQSVIDEVLNTLKSL